MASPMLVNSLWHARQLLSAGRRRRVVYVAGIESLAHAAAMGELLHRASRLLLPKTRRWAVCRFHDMRNLGAISCILTKLRRIDLPGLHREPLCLQRIQRVRQRALRVHALSFRVGPGAPGQRTRALAVRLLLLANDAQAQVLLLIANDAQAQALPLHALRQRVEQDIEAVRAELQRPVDMFEEAAA